MKQKLTLLLLILLINLSLKAQNTGAHQHEPPPASNFPFTRGMYIDCSNDIISDIKNGNPLGLFADLKMYIRDNYIGYIALYGLDHSAVIGNPQLEPSLRYFLSNLRQNFPDIKIGAIGSSDGFFTGSAYLRVNDYFNRVCFPSNSVLRLSQVDSLVNRSSTPAELKRKELCRFFLRAASMSRSRHDRHSNRCEAAFDALYLDYPYWENAGTLPLADIQSEFEAYKSILKVMQLLKCSFSCITSVEAEFQPTDAYRLSGWTATDQITEADPLIDKMMIPAYSNSLNPGSGFDVACRNLHLLSDRFTKDGSAFYIGLSARSNSYNYCNSSDIPDDHLGAYLDGTNPVSGNLYSVENFFIDKLNNPLYFCSGCSCYSYNDNQYSTTSPASNRCSGSMWYSYGMMRTHNITKIRSSDEIVLSEMNSILHIELSSETTIVSARIIDCSGKIVRELKNNDSISLDIETAELAPGMYFLDVTDSENRKFNRIMPVLYR